MLQAHSTTALSALSASIIRTLVYSGLFRYPLTREEIFNRIDTPGVSKNDAFSAIDELVEAGYVYHHESFYSLESDPALVEKRRKGNEMARKKMKVARRMSRFIYHFPFTEAVFLSGSISKEYMDETTDIDYFIIAKPGRLWLCRTLLIAFKKVFLLNSYKHFCLNYFIDSEHLEIEEQNLFTATEVATLIPAIGEKTQRSFFDANSWTQEFYPNFRGDKPSLIAGRKRSMIKAVSEGILNTGLGAALDRYCMRITVKHWKRKFEEFDPGDFEVAMKSRQYVSKHHPGNFQRRVLDGFRQGVRNFEEKHGLSFSPAYE